MLCSWLNCYSWHPKPVVAQDSTSEAHVPECSLRMAARISCGLVLLVGVQGSGPAAGKNRAGAGIGMWYLSAAQLNPMSGRQVSRFL